MLIRQEEMQRQDELHEIALQEELQAIEVELGRRRQKTKKKNVQKYPKKLFKLFPLADLKLHWKFVNALLQKVISTCDTNLFSHYRYISMEPHFWPDTSF